MLSKKEKAQISGILSDLKKVEQYIKSDKVHVCIENKFPNNFSYVNKEGRGLDSIEKQVGTTFCYLYNGIRNLERMITPVIIQKMETEG